MANKKIIVSVDAESNGLRGGIFSIAGVGYDESGKEISRFLGRCPIEENINPWVKQNVIPKMKEIPENYNSYKELLLGFLNFWKSLKAKADVIHLSHMGHIVEAGLWRDAYEMQLIGEFESPYLWYDICIFPQVGDSVDNYVKSHNLPVPTLIGGTHNPLYDAIVTAEVYFDVMKTLK